eukprot:m51a1_g14365 putative nephrocystin-1 isoform x1 (809) ;mRNA; r:229976-232532
MAASRKPHYQSATDAAISEPDEDGAEDVGWHSGGTADDALSTDALSARSSASASSSRVPRGTDSPSTSSSRTPRRAGAAAVATASVRRSSGTAGGTRGPRAAERRRAARRVYDDGDDDAAAAAGSDLSARSGRSEAYVDDGEDGVPSTADEYRDDDDEEEAEEEEQQHEEEPLSPAPRQQQRQQQQRAQVARGRPPPMRRTQQPQQRQQQQQQREEAYDEGPGEQDDDEGEGYDDEGEQVEEEEAGASEQPYDDEASGGRRNPLGASQSELAYEGARDAYGDDAHDGVYREAPDAELLESPRSAGYGGGAGLSSMSGTSRRRPLPAASLPRHAATVSAGPGAPGADTTSSRSTPMPLMRTMLSTLRPQTSAISSSSRPPRMPLDYLKAYGAMPAGYRVSTLAEAVKHGRCLLSTALTPQLAPSGLTYRDLAVDPETRTVRKRFFRSAFKVTLCGATSVPPPGAGADVTQRRVRVALWDNAAQRAVSNAHAVVAELAEPGKADCRSWRFPFTQGVWAQRSGENAFLVRTSIANPALCVLFELCIVSRRMPQAAAPGQPASIELSCGWCKMPLYREAPGAAGATLVQTGKTYEMPLQGGTPYDADVPIDPLEAAAAPATTSVAARLFGRGRKQALLAAKLSALSRTDQDECATLPANIVASFSTVPLANAYRQHLLAQLVLAGAPMRMCAPAAASDPAARAFLAICDDALALEGAKAVWHARTRALGRKERRNAAVLAQCWRATVAHLAPLLGEVSTGAADAARRFERVQQFVEAQPETNAVRNPNNILYSPMSIAEATFAVTATATVHT